jgi:predicted ATPase
MLIAGDAGIGKTRLVTEVCSRASQAGMLTAVGGCVQLSEASAPYAPLVGVLRELRRQLGTGRVAELLGAARAQIGLLFGP